VKYTPVSLYYHHYTRLGVELITIKCDVSEGRLIPCIPLVTDVSECYSALTFRFEMKDKSNNLTTIDKCLALLP
jgi:hypothetical protein